jgi:hypothetical protein
MGASTSRRNKVKKRAVLDIRSPVTMIRLVVLGLCFSVYDHIVYGAGLLTPTLAALLPFSAVYVAIVPSAGQLLAIVYLLPLTTRVSRRKFGLVCGVVVTLAIGGARVWPSGIPMVVCLLIAAVFTVTQLAVWSAVLDAISNDEDRGTGSTWLIVPYSVGLSLWSWQTGRVMGRWEAADLFGVFFVALAVTTVVMTLLCPPERDNREPDGPIRIRPLLIAACSGIGLMLFDGQIAALFLATGLHETHAAWSGTAMGIGGMIALVLKGLLHRRDRRSAASGEKRESDRFLVFVGAVVLLGAFVLGGVAAVLSSLWTVVALWLLYLARIAEEFGTSLASMLVPALAKGAAFMAAVQIARGLGKFMGGYAGGATLDAYGFDAGHPARNIPAVLAVMGLGGFIALIGIALGWLELRKARAQAGDRSH